MLKLTEIVGHGKENKRNAVTRKNFVLRVVPLTFSVAMFTSTSAQAADRVIHTGENSFMIWDGDTANVYFYPNAAGTVELTAWHTSYVYYNKVAAMSFYWRDNSVPNDPWHQWRNAAVGYTWPKLEQSLYSGSSSIQYKFVLQPLDADFLAIVIKLE